MLLYSVTFTQRICKNHNVNLKYQHNSVHCRSIVTTMAVGIKIKPSS